MKKLQPVRGTKDILEEEYRQIYDIACHWHLATEGFGFKMIQTPIIEDSEVFKKTLLVVLPQPGHAVTLGAKDLIPKFCSISWAT